MTGSATELRNVTISARTGIGDAGPALWSAQIIVGLLNRPDNQDVPKGPPHDIFRAAAVRVVAQDADPIPIKVGGETLPGYHPPRLVQGAVRARDTTNNDVADPTSTLTICGGGDSPGTAATAELDPHIGSPPAPSYSDVLLGLNETIKSKLGIQIELPELTLEAGAIKTLLRLDAGSAAKWLGVTLGSPSKIFGARSNITIATTKIGKARYLPVSLVPEGIEFDATLVDPFVAPPGRGTPAPAPLTLRLLLTYDAELSQFMLRPGTAEQNKPDADRLRASFDDLVRQLGGDGKPLLAEVDPKGLPFAWSLGEGAPGGSLDASASKIYIDYGAVRVRLNSDAPDGSDIPTVCQLKVRSASINLADRSLTISCDSSAVLPISAASGPADVTATFTWVGQNPGTVSVDAEPAAPQVIDTVTFEQRLRTRYTSAGLLEADPQMPLYAFLPLERGMLQLPLSFPVANRAATPSAADRSAFSGLVRSHMKISDNRDDATVEVTNAVSAEITVVPATPRTTTAVFAGARGTAAGLVFAAAASPSPSSILPPLDAGPIACEPLDIVFGDPEVSSVLSVRWDKEKTQPNKLTMTITLADKAKADDRAGDAIYWRAHPRMALVSTMPMTRTRFDATRPSTTRDLVPFTIPGTSRTFVLTTALNDANRSPFPSLKEPATGSTTIGQDPVWPWPTANDSSQIGEANDAISNISASSLTLPGIEMALDSPDWNKIKASLRYDLPILGELFASAMLPKAPAAGGSSQTSDVPEHAPTALEPAALSAYWTLTANRHALSRTINDRATDWIAIGTSPSTGSMTTFVEPYTFVSGFDVTMDSAGLPVGAYALFGKTVAGSSALAGWSGDLTTPQGGALEIVGFSARLYDGTAGGPEPALFDTRGIGQAITPRTRPLLPHGLVELRDTARLDSTNNSNNVKQIDQVTLTAAHIGFRFAGVDCGLRLRDLPMIADGGGNLSFASTITNADNTRTLIGPEGDLGPDGSVFERRQLPLAVFEWSFYKTSDTPSFVFRLGALDVRPLRLIGVSLTNDTAGLRLSRFEIIANVEAPVPVAGPRGPVNDDVPYAAGNPVAFAFTVSADGSEATLAALHPVSVSERTIVVGTSGVAGVNFRAIANLSYGATDVKPGAGTASRAHRTLPIVLEMSLQASGVAASPLKIASAAVNAVLFGSQTHIAFSMTSLTDTLHFEYQALAAPQGQLQVPRVALTWSRSPDQPVLLLCARLRLPVAVAAEVLPAGVTRNLVDWQVGATLGWFGAKLSGTALSVGEYFDFDVDHDKGTLNLSTGKSSLADEAAFTQGWSIAKAPFTFALAAAFPPVTAPALFPAAPSAGFVEATCGTTEGLYIRHRMIKPGQIRGRPADWDTRILVSLSNRSLVSAISWPIDGLSATFPDAFAPSSRIPADWRETIKVDGTGAHTHSVTLVVRDAELPAVNLIESGGTIKLAVPWTFPALATHELKGSSATLTWTSVDEIVVGHMAALEREAKQTLDAPPGELAFVARYRDSAPKLQPFAVSAGLFSKALARAGIPTLEMLIGLRLAPKAVDPVTQTSASDLFIAGASLIEVATEKDGAAGYRVVTPWIAPLFPGKALGVLGSIPQAPWNGEVSSYDLMPHAAARLGRETAIPFSTSNASVAWIERYRDRIARSLPNQSVPNFQPVSQAIIEDVELPKDGDDPAHWLGRPIWLRTLAAWKGILTSTPKQQLIGRTVTVTPILVGDPKTSTRTTAVRLALHRSVDDQSVGSDFVASADPGWPPGSSYEVIVLTRNGVTAIAVANADAKTLRESQISGDQRNRLAQLALAVPDEPLAAALGELTDLPAELLTDDQRSYRTHRVGGFLELPAYLDAVRQPHPLRDRERTVFPSAALAWPRAAVGAGWQGVSEPAAMELGDQRPLQDAQYSWAGDVRSFSVTDGAPAPDKPFLKASVLTIGQRALFRRPTDEDLTAPPDRALIPVPPRARVPGADSVELGLKPVRLKTSTKNADGENVPEAAIAPIQPGNFEIVTTGRRPGVLFFQYDGLSFADGDISFDPHQPRFGRPADRGPVLFRQTRAPRSTVYQPMDDLSRRRQTFIGSDYLDDAKHLLPFALARGSMTALRTSRGDGSAATVETILLRLARSDASPFSIAANWNGTLTLTATLYASDANAAGTKLAEVGLNAPATRFVLAINGTQLTFPAPVIGGATPNPHFKPHSNPVIAGFDVPITLSLANADKALAQKVLQSADADSAATLTLSLPASGTPAPPPDSKPNLQPGPPRLLSMAVPIAATLQPSLRIESATLAFGDPAYDREISSKTLSAVQLVKTVTYLLALDRLEYDLTSTLYFAAGPIVNPPGQDPSWDRSSPVQMTLQLGVLYKAEQAVVHPTPLAVGCCKTVDNNFPPRHEFKPGQAYTITLSDLRKAVPNKSDGTGGYTLQAASLAPGDRIVVTVFWQDGSLEVAATLVADPVLSPPAAAYGLATLDRDRAAMRLTSSLFATAPLPQIVEFQDLAGDLAKGLVRRRAMFVWPYSPRTMPPVGKPYGALVKFDRAGGGQLPDSDADFQPLLI